MRQEPAPPCDVRRGSRLFGHPWHVAFVHLPMGLLLLPLPLDVAGCLSSDSLFWWQASRGGLAIGVATGLGAAITGLVDLAAIAKDSAAERVATRHLSAMLIALTLFAVDGALRLESVTPSGFTRVLAVALSALGTLTLMLGGWWGGELVHRHGVGHLPRDP